jgi:hypothetical protein
MIGPELDHLEGGPGRGLCSPGDRIEPAFSYENASGRDGRPQRWAGFRRTASADYVSLLGLRARLPGGPMTYQRYYQLVSDRPRTSVWTSVWTTTWRSTR